MAAVDFYIVQNDTAPVLARTLLDSDGNAVILTGATVRFNMRALGSATVTVNRASCTITGATTGDVSYAWIAADTATVGDYEGEFEVTFANGKVQTFPNPTKMRIKITDDIA